MAASIQTKSTDRDESGKRDAFGFIWQPGTDSDHYFVELPLSVVKEREKKWLEILSDWPTWAEKKPAKIKQLCRKGIPSSLRQQVWMQLCGAQAVKKSNPTRFQELLEMPGDEFNLKCIELDIKRTFCNHEFFQTPQGKDDLKKVLKAFTLQHRDTGYASGLSYLAATFLLTMPAEDAFWCLVQLVEHYMPEYFVPGMVGFQVDSEILDELTAQYLPETNRFMKNAHYQASLICTDWLVLLFTRSLPWSCVLRIWDMYLCEGNRVKFRIALGLVRLSFGKKKQREKCREFFEISQKLRHLTIFETHEDILIPESLKFHIKDEDIQQMYRKHKHRIAQEHKANKAVRRATFCGSTNGPSKPT